jgi:hypothetical protein
MRPKLPIIARPRPLAALLIARRVTFPSPEGFYAASSHRRKDQSPLVVVEVGNIL